MHWQYIVKVFKTFLTSQSTSSINQNYEEAARVGFGEGVITNKCWIVKTGT